MDQIFKVKLYLNYVTEFEICRNVRWILFKYFRDSFVNMNTTFVFWYIFALDICNWKIIIIESWPLKL